MRFERNLLRHHIIHELKNADLGIPCVRGGLDVATEIVLELLQGLGRIGKEKQSPPMIVRHDGIDVDTNENTNVGHFLQIGTNRKIARSSQVANQCIKPLDIGIVLKNALELLKQRLRSLACEQAS